MNHLQPANLPESSFRVTTLMGRSTSGTFWFVRRQLSGCERLGT